MRDGVGQCTSPAIQRDVKNRVFSHDRTEHGSSGTPDVTAEIVSSHVANNTVAVSDLPILIANVYAALAKLGGVVAPEKVQQEPAVSIRASVKPDFITCLEDGKKLKMLKRHLMVHFNLTPDEYRLITVGDASGNRMARAPRVTANAAVDYSMLLGSNLSADFNVTYSYTSKFFWEPDNYLFEDPYSLVNAKLTFNFSDRHKISIWGRNLTDKFYSVVSGAAAPGSVNSPGEPRTYGVAFETKF